MTQGLVLALILVACISVPALARKTPPHEIESAKNLSESVSYAQTIQDAETPSESTPAMTPENPSEDESSVEEEPEILSETDRLSTPEVDSVTMAGSGTETAATPKLDITLASVIEKRAGQIAYTAPILEISYHLREDLLVDFIAPWTILKTRGNHTKEGAGNLQTGVQWQFLDESTYGFSALVFPRIDFNIPGSSSAKRGLVAEGMTFSLPIQVGKTFGSIGIAMEAGYSFIEHQDNESFYSLAAIYGLSDRTELLGQVIGTAREDFKQGDAAFTLGVRWWYSDHVALLASAGRGLYDSTGSTIEFLSSFGIQFSY